MSQNATDRGARNAVMNSRLRDFAGYRLAVDCGTAACGGERVYSVADLARMHGGDILIGTMVTRLRCRLCGAAVRTCFMETGPELAQRARMRRVALMGREGARDER